MASVGKKKAYGRDREGVYCVSQVALVYTAKWRVKIEFKMGSVALPHFLKLQLFRLYHKQHAEYQQSQKLTRKRFLKKFLLIEGSYTNNDGITTLLNTQIRRPAFSQCNFF